MATGRGFWRQPVAWVLVGLPAAGVIALAATIMLAMRDPVDGSAARTQRIAQIQMEDLAADRMAAEQGIRAHLTANAGSGEFELALLAVDADIAPPVLTLAMRHPVREAQDRRVTLTRAGDRWHGRTDPWPPHQAWNLQLVADSPAWRIAGRLAADATEAELAPAVAR